MLNFALWSKSDQLIIKILCGVKVSGNHVELCWPSNELGLASFIQPGEVVCVSNSLPGTLLCSQHHRKIQVGQAALQCRNKPKLSQSQVAAHVQYCTTESTRARL